MGAESQQPASEEVTQTGDAPPPADGRGVRRRLPDGGDAVAENQEVRGLMVQIEDDLRKLSAREESLIRLRFGIGEPAHSRDELERRLGMSSGWLRQVERRALRNLRSTAIRDDAAMAVAARPRKPPT